MGNYSTEFLLNNTIAGQVVRKLDSMDAKGTDNKIDVSIWNNFITSHGGTKIDNSETISMDKEINLITKLAVKEAAEQRKNGQTDINANTVAKQYLQELGSTSSKTNPFDNGKTSTAKTDKTSNTNPTQNVQNSDFNEEANRRYNLILNTQRLEYAGQTIKQDGVSYIYDENGYVINTMDKKYRILYTRDKDGNIKNYLIKNRDEDEESLFFNVSIDRLMRTKRSDLAGKTIFVNGMECVYNKNGKVTKISQNGEIIASSKDENEVEDNGLVSSIVDFATTYIPIWRIVKGITS